MKKIYAILAVAAVTACTAFAVSSFASRDPFFEANVEALMQTEINHCPNPYDVPHHFLYYQPYEGRYQVEMGGYIMIAGKSLRIPGVEVGCTVYVNYDVGNCLNPQEGACCPHSQNGEVRLLGCKLA